MKLTKKCRQCRAEGKKLFLKGERCDLAKCSFTRRSYAPGKKQKGFTRLSDYGKQLRAKQSAKRSYGLSEKQLKRYYSQASKTKSATGEKLLQFLECRLDNVVYRLGLAPSRISARQIICHGKIKLNNKKADIPSIILKKGDIVSVSEKSNIASNLKSEAIPVWLKLDKNKKSGELIKIPTKNELSLDIEEQLIVEFYSR